MFRLLLLTLVLPMTASANGYSPADNPLMTRWGKEVTPENAWKEYPRPQMVRERWLNLNGLWDYAITPKGSRMPDEWEGQILVPYPVESALSGVKKGLSPDERLWYRRTLEVPADWSGERVLLNFGAVDWQCGVWINKVWVGAHEGGFDSFTMDVTDYLSDSGEQEIIVSVWDPSSALDQPRGKQQLNQEGIWYTPASGIWQTVWMEPVPMAASVGDLRITPDVDNSQVHVTVIDRYPKGGSDYAFRAKVLKDGEVVAEKTHRISRTVAIDIPDPELWSPDNPFLYDLEVDVFRISNPNVPGGTPRYSEREGSFFRIGNNAELLDSVKSYFGMRKVGMGTDEAGNRVFTLNGEQIFHYGPLDQGYWPDGLLTPPSAEAMKFELEFLKEAGFNMLRKHIKIEPAIYYHYADQMGLLVWQDMPSGYNSTDQQSFNHDAADPVRRRQAMETFELELRRMIDDLYNYPSIVMWVPFNEGWGQYDTGRIARWVKDYDPTRTVNSVSGWTDRNVGEMLDIHSYNPNVGMPRGEEPDRIKVIGEFGGLGLPVEDHLWWTNRRNWGYQTYQTKEELKDQYINRFDQIIQGIKRHGVAGAVYTQTTDVEGEVNGLMTYDRDVIKIPADELAEIHAEAYKDLPRLTQKVILKSGLNPPVLWKYTTDNPGEGWTKPSFDDSGWDEAPAPFGREPAAMDLIRTEWTTPNIWMRRDFVLSEEQVKALNDPRLLIRHDEGAEVYINGTRVASTSEHVMHHIEVPFAVPAKEVLKAGKNTISMHVSQTLGGQFADVGIIDLREVE